MELEQEANCSSGDVPADVVDLIISTPEPDVASSSGTTMTAGEPPARQVVQNVYRTPQQLETRRVLQEILAKKDEINLKRNELGNIKVVGLLKRKEELKARLKFLEACEQHGIEIMEDGLVKEETFLENAMFANCIHEIKIITTPFKRD